jgi:hypothetical protein
MAGNQITVAIKIVWPLALEVRAAVFNLIPHSRDICLSKPAPMVQPAGAMPAPPTAMAATMIAILCNTNFFTALPFPLR